MHWSSINIIITPSSFYREYSFISWNDHLMDYDRNFLNVSFRYSEIIR